MHGPMDRRGEMMRGHVDMIHGRGGMEGDMGPFHIAPMGMWWKNSRIVERLTLTPEQTKKMDEIFQQSRLQLIDLHANVEKQEVLLDPMLNSNPVDTTRAMAQIDKLAQARADLEKANAKMLLGIRAVLTPDQWTKLNTHRFGGPEGQGGQGGPQGRSAHGGGPTGPNDNLVAPVDQP
jgi:Spy/CpxP family protein refolding chaperone